MTSLAKDARYAIRRLLSAPGFTVAAALTLALGIGANSTIFSVLNAIVLRPPAAVTSPERLVAIERSDCVWRGDARAGGCDTYRELAAGPASESC